MCGQILTANEEINYYYKSSTYMLFLWIVTCIRHDSFDGHALLSKSSIFSLFLNSCLYKLHALFIELMEFFSRSQILQNVMIFLLSQWPECFPAFWLPRINENAVYEVQTNRFWQCLVFFSRDCISSRQKII